MKKKITAIILAFALTTSLLGISISAADNTSHFNFAFSGNSILHKTDENYVFDVADYNGDGKLDLYVIKKQGTSNTEVHILNGATNFTTYLLNTSTLLHKTSSDWNFVVADYNKDSKADVIAINRNGGTGSTEIHILDGANKFQKWLLNTSTILHTTGSLWTFEAGDYNVDGKLDIYAINRTATTTTDVHILNGANSYQGWLLSTQTILHQTNESYDFQLGDYNNDGKPDLYVIKRQGENSTEVHILDGAKNYRAWMLNTGTPLHKTANTWSFLVGKYNSDNRPDVFAVNRTGTSTTDLHVLAGVSSSNPYVTPLPGRTTINHFLNCGCSLHNGKHNGIDFPTSDKPDVLAVHSGTISIVRTCSQDYGKSSGKCTCGQCGDMGNCIDVIGDNGVTTRYMHLSSFAVSSGQRVSVGQKIGNVGSTGGSTGNHLHLELRLNGVLKNPLDYFSLI